MPDRTRPTDETREAGARDATADHEPDRPPTEDEDRAAPERADESTAKAYEEQTKRGAETEGEGRIP